VITFAVLVSFTGQKWLGKHLKLLITFNKSQTNIINFLSSLFNEFVIVLFVLTALFWLATWQAKDDA